MGHVCGIRVPKPSAVQQFLLTDVYSARLAGGGGGGGGGLASGVH